MTRIHAIAATLVAAGLVVACSSNSGKTTTSTSTNLPSDCGSNCDQAGGGGSNGGNGSQGSNALGDSQGETTGDGPQQGVQDGTETDVDCGGESPSRCGLGKKCVVDGDCEVACNYAHVCVAAPSCKTHMGGDTCGMGEVGADGKSSATNEDCCRSLPVAGFSDAMHPGQTVYVDKYEITAGRIREWIAEVAAANGGVPDIKTWVQNNRPDIWDANWDQFLPSNYEGGTVVIARRLLGDPRPEDNGDKGPPGPGVILPPATDQPRDMGVNSQFGSTIYVDLHGSDCATWDGSFGFSTFYYPDAILARDGQKPRATGVDFAGQTIAAQDLLDVKSMNCITNEMLAAFCAWDGGQLVTDEVLDYITQTPATLGNVSGCGVQIDNHGNLLNNDYTGTVRTGGACPDVAAVNATFDAGDNLPVPNSPLNVHNYHFPDLGNQTFDKAWEVSAPGRGSLAAGFNGGQADAIALHPGDEPWMDLAGNLSEASFDMNGGAFTGLFALKYRGIGYGSARSDLNMTLMKGETILRVQRPEAKGAFTGGRCMRFR